MITVNTTEKWTIAKVFRTAVTAGVGLGIGTMLFKLCIFMFTLYNSVSVPVGK